MSEPQEIERQMLETIIAKKASVTLFLVNGVKLVGTVVAFDKGSVALKRDAIVQLVAAEVPAGEEEGEMPGMGAGAIPGEEGGEFEMPPEFVMIPTGRPSS